MTFRRQSAFTLIEIMIVVGILGILASIAVSNFLRGRKRSEATRILEDLRIIDSAIDQYAIETNRAGGTVIQWADIQGFLVKGSVVYNSGGMDLLGNAYVGFSVDSIPKLRSNTFAKLSDVAPSDFWSPYYP